MVAFSSAPDALAPPSWGERFRKAWEYYLEKPRNGLPRDSRILTRLHLDVFARFGVNLHGGKTHLIEFGRSELVNSSSDQFEHGGLVDDPGDSRHDLDTSCFSMPEARRCSG